MNYKESYVKTLLRPKGQTTGKSQWVYYLDQMQDDFWPLRQWPEWAIRGIQGRPGRGPGNDMRYQLFYFLVGNGLQPEQAGEWICVAGRRNGRLIIDTAHNGKAGQHAQQMIKAVQKPAPHARPFFRGDKKVFDMVKGRVVNM